MSYGLGLWLSGVRGFGIRLVPGEEAGSGFAELIFAKVLFWLHMALQDFRNVGLGDRTLGCYFP